MVSDMNSKLPLLDRRDVVKVLLADRGDLLVVTGLGSPTYDCASVGDHEHNFYLWGAMGGAVMVGLGLALAQPSRPVMVLTGDGECLMGLGAFATVAVHQPPNFSVVIIDNERYGETGKQLSHTAHGVDLPAVAVASGIRRARTIRDDSGVHELAHDVRAKEGTLVACVKVKSAEAPRIMPSRDGAWIKERFRRAVLNQPVLELT